MKFEIQAVIKEIGAIETVGAKGFQKRNLILTEQSGEYENLICVEFSGDKLGEPEQYQAGQTVSVHGFINCREWNTKYFTSLKGSFINAVGNQQPPAPEMGQAGYNAPQAPVPQTTSYPASDNPLPHPSPEVPKPTETDIPF